MPQTEILQKFKQLDTSSSAFPDQLTNLFFQREYKDCIPSLRDEEVVWLVNYLDDVCLFYSLPCSFLSMQRLSNHFKPILPAQRSEDACVNSGGSAVPDNACPSRTYYLKILFRSSVNSPLLLEVLVMSMKAP